MPSKKKGFGIRLTAAEDALITREREATGAPSLSFVFEQALLDLLAERERFGVHGLPVPSSRIPPSEMIPRQFRLKETTLALISETQRDYNWTKQSIARAALLRLAQAAANRDRAADRDEPDNTAGQPSTHTGR